MCDVAYENSESDSFCTFLDLKTEIWRNGSEYRKTRKLVFSYACAANADSLCNIGKMKICPNYLPLIIMYTYYA